ncbi:MAG: hypothetical protein C5B50_19555 [Verrucomicrobia bacterium]|nr:MAG: hypothetical protein C5B50_19555 [Verrucomicrobiota bacterium]
MPGPGRPFTRETALAASREGNAKLAMLRATNQLPHRARTAPCHANNGSESTSDTRAQHAMNKQLVIVREQINETRAVLNASDGGPPCPKCGRGTLHPRDRAQLVKALDALFDRERKLLNVPEPGRMKPQHKPVSERRGPTIAEIAACLAKPNHAPSPAPEA